MLIETIIATVIAIRPVIQGAQEAVAGVGRNVERHAKNKETFKKIEAHLAFIQVYLTNLRAIGAVTDDPSCQAALQILADLLENNIAQEFRDAGTFRRLLQNEGYAEKAETWSLSVNQAMIAVMSAVQLLNINQGLALQAAREEEMSTLGAMQTMMQAISVEQLTHIFGEASLGEEKAQAVHGPELRIEGVSEKLEVAQGATSLVRAFFATIDRATDEEEAAELAQINTSLTALVGRPIRIVGARRAHVAPGGWSDIQASFTRKVHADLERRNDEAETRRKEAGAEKAEAEVKAVKSELALKLFELKVITREELLERIDGKPSVPPQPPRSAEDFDLEMLSPEEVRVQAVESGALAPSVADVAPQLAMAEQPNNGNQQGMDLSPK